MLSAQLTTAALFALMLAPAVDRADPLNPKQIPAEAKWILHIDLDAARDSKTLDLVQQDFLSGEAAQAKIEQIETISGTRIPDDLDDVTLYGKDAGEEAGVILIHGKLDPAKTQSSLEMADQFTSNPYGNYAVFNWFDKEKNHTVFAAFHDNANLIVGRSEAVIEMALDAMDGKSESLKADSPLVAGLKPQLLVYVAARDIPHLRQPGSKPNPVVSAVDSAWICLSEKDQTVTMHATLSEKSAETAANLRTTLEGLKSMLTLASGGDDADPVAKAVVGASKTFATTQQDQAVMVDWPVTVDQWTGILKAISDKRADNN